MYIPGAEELVIFICAFIGALIGFLWYNAYPAQVFMGDTGSLTIGGIIAVYAIIIHKELLIPILCGIFLVENLSVILQTPLLQGRQAERRETTSLQKNADTRHHPISRSPVEPGMQAIYLKPYPTWCSRIEDHRPVLDCHRYHPGGYYDYDVKDEIK